eukprot:359790-Pleurochrysis_carterae.AAC.4
MLQLSGTERPLRLPDDLSYGPVTGDGADQLEAGRADTVRPGAHADGAALLAMPTALGFGTPREAASQTAAPQ